LTKIFIIAQAIFVFVVLVYIYLANAPKAVSPIAGKSVSELEFVIEDADTIIVSRDPEFSNPTILEEGEDISLPPGTYYWKVKNWLRESEVYTFTIETTVVLNLIEEQDKKFLENDGNVDVKVTEKKAGITTGSFEIEIGDNEEISEDKDYEGGQK